MQKKFLVVQQKDTSLSGSVADLDDDETCFNLSALHGVTRQEVAFPKLHSVAAKDLFEFQSAELPSTSLDPYTQEHVVRCIWSDGCLYEGGWDSVQQKGRGKILWPSGSQYEGEMMGGYLHGMGLYTHADGSSYDGSWVFNKKQGYGKKRYANGDVYQGFWKWDVPHGRGKYLWDNGSEYDGNWYNGMMCGYGVFSWANGDKYKGQWLNGVAEGPGIYYWADGCMYAGTWRRGKRCGEGQLWHAGMLKSSMKSEESCIARDMRIEFFPGQKMVSSSHLCRRLRILPHEASADRNVLFLCPQDKHGRKLLLKQFKNTHSPNRCEFESLEVLHVDGYGCNTKASGLLIPFSADGITRHSWLMKEPKRSCELISRDHRNFELKLNLQLGIRSSVGKVHQELKRKLLPSDFNKRANLKMNFPREGSTLTPPHQSCDFKWKDYCPLVFRHLRELFKVDAEDYMLSFCGNEDLREFSSPGKSGSVFYLSQNEHFMIKTLRNSEVKVLRRMLPRYHRHVRMYRNTLLTKFLGLYRIRIAGGPTVRFVIMVNIVSTESWIHRLYDLKGSSQGRFCDKIRPSSGTTLKDLDLDLEFHLDPEDKDSLLWQISRDCKFLESLRIMDYSLLLGLHFESSQTLRKEAELSVQEIVISRFVANKASSLEFEVTSMSSGLASSAQKNCDSSRLFSGRAKATKSIFSLNGRHNIQLGAACMPATAYHRHSNGESIGVAVSYNVLLYFGIIDILQEYDVGKKNRACI